ncbi:MAG: hypothetical protein ABMA02_18755 [Saprospiraceae bacterium]
MTHDRFLRYLDSPDLLATISYEELKTLALAYPYAHNLRYLLVLKSAQGDKNSDFERNLASAAAYSLDRKRLFLLLAPRVLAPKLIEQEEPILELRPIEAVQRELEAKTPLAKKEEREPPPNSELTAVPPAQSADVRPPAENNKAEDVEESPEVPPTPVLVPTAEAKSVSPSGEASFGAWISRFQPPTLVDARPTRVRPTGDLLPMPEADTDVSEARENAGAKQPGSPQALAERSVTESKTIVSETLAKLYARQGYRDKAIDMYERLCLAFPDKCAYFAAEIEKLKK